MDRKSSKPQACRMPLWLCHSTPIFLQLPEVNATQLVLPLAPGKHACRCILPLGVTDHSLRSVGHLSQTCTHAPELPAELQLMLHSSLWSCCAPMQCLQRSCNQGCRCQSRQGLRTRALADPEGTYGAQRSNGLDVLHVLKAILAPYLLY